jgi:hypothetical protein
MRPHKLHDAAAEFSFASGKAEFCFYDYKDKNAFILTIDLSA